MTDINEIIGRALLTLKDKHAAGFVGYDAAGDDLRIDGYFPFADIGAAVVKALGEAGYVIGQKVDGIVDEPALIRAAFFADGNGYRVGSSCQKIMPYWENGQSGQVPFLAVYGYGDSIIARVPAHMVQIAYTD